MKRTNTFEVVPMSDADEELLRRVMDASASLWNELTYERRQQFFDGDSVWNTEDYRKRYVGVLGSASAQQTIRKNDQAWKGFFDSDEPDEGLPGYWGNEEDGRKLRWFGRNDQYTIQWGKRSRLEIPVGKDLKDEYSLSGRLRLEVRGEPRWDGKQCQLELQYDEQPDQFRAYQPVEVTDTDSHPRLGTPVADGSAALDIGANNIVACTTTTGEQFLYAGRDLFDRFRDTTQEIARLQSLLEDGRYSSHRIRRLYRRRTRRRDHAMDALARDLIERLHKEGVATVYVGALTDILETHWSVEANAKTHNFWAFRAFIDRLATTAEEYGLSVEARSEAWTSQECPQCGSTERTTRHKDTLTCECGFEGHADLVASETFLKRYTTVARPMARPVCLKWDNHDWLEISHSHRPNEEHTNPQVASVGVGSDARPPARGIPRL
ncbi:MULTISPECIES: IS200/IS605 family transposon protein TnpB [Halococcus]|uniref:Transposase, IS605 OrfB family protein n=1 Tax=Halococcus salifodinae DSM 8989 TaxID=1227456 RepID=M0MTJ5_9EURY|nr:MULTISPECIES: IS200/IS605 family transposon protein TnpB [Halococcus]EMA48064.1 transposase, IS605 OrfB family protein [Halococcus salifodinae DSM 8989]